jgi:methylmalonyl-CoA mutase
LPNLNGNFIMEDIYKPTNKIRIVTAASLFDGHDAAINVMRRIIQATGCEVIHLGHNRSVQEIVDCAIQEDVQGIAMTSYQGGHTEYLKYMYDLLKEAGAGHIKIFAGGGGVILPTEIAELQAYGITRIYSPDDGRTMGLQGMINDLVMQCDYPVIEKWEDIQWNSISSHNHLQVAKAISFAENKPDSIQQFRQKIQELGSNKNVPVIGITGTGGAGKSSLVDELVRRFIHEFRDKTLAIVSVDPSKRKTGGALLGDRIRMNSINNDRVFMRSMATREANLALSPFVKDALEVYKAAGFDLIILESAGIGQADSSVVDLADVALYVMTPEFGAASQLEKIDMIDFADLIAINKFDKKGALDAQRDVKKQYKRSHRAFDISDEDIPVYGTMASQFNDPGVNNLYRALMDKVVEKTHSSLESKLEITPEMSQKIYIVPPEKTRYLAEIVENAHRYKKFAREQAGLASQLYKLKGTLAIVNQGQNKDSVAYLDELYSLTEERLHPDSRRLLREWPEMQKTFTANDYVYKVRDKEIHVPLYSESLSHLKIPKIALPKFSDWGDILYWLLMENIPGEFPYAAGVYPLKRTEEDPTRMFAGEGGPERTNKRFHYVSKGSKAKRLSTAFDSVTLYGEDPHHRPDIYGKIGNSGVSIATVDDAKKLYSGFNLADPMTSVSMTINGPAPMLLGFFMNAAIDQQCEKYIKDNGLEVEVSKKLDAIFKAKNLARPTYSSAMPDSNDGLGLSLLGVSGEDVLDKDTYEKIKTKTLSVVRGTVQADILKEDQAQNTCIFSIEFALRMMGDIQQYFIENKVRNFYSVSISGYHIAEAGANPITQLALTISNGFTFVEYYLNRGMNIDDFAPNLSFFFSNGIDPEYSVIGRVARIIWAKAIKQKYNGNARSQMLKYHIQTSGRSLHAQEIDFNDIRTTLQALYAIYDNCNSLHTNAYDEAITTPTEESVRRAMAIQLIINKELGLAKNENPLQGSFIIDELTELVEEAVYAEFNRISERGGVLGAMETMYQRNLIQEESLYYERLKHDGEYPIIGVNTFLSTKGSPTVVPLEVIRSTTEEKELQIKNVQLFQERNKDRAPEALQKLKEAALNNRNIFEQLMEACKVCSLGQISNTLYEVGGQYRRNM